MADSIKTPSLSFVPWLRRGLSRHIDATEKDTLGLTESQNTKSRAQLSVKTTFDLTPVSTDRANVEKNETLKISLIGPGDVGGIKKLSVLQVVPADGITNFESNFFPFIEFFEEDMPWRYTPAKENLDKLRPWLSILVCKRDEFALATDSDGRTIVRLKVNSNEQFQEILGDPTNIWKNAHVHFIGQKLQNTSGNALNNKVNNLLNSDEDTGFSRLLSSRVLEENTAYTAFLIPSFDTGRLSGLGLSFNDIPAQKSSWAKTLDLQKSNYQNPLDFPVYYSWEFETSIGSFIELARKLKAIPTDDLPAALRVDVSKMGNGLNYSTFEQSPSRKIIDVPAATHPIGFTSVAFPSLEDELEVFDRMKSLLENNPVLLENKEILDDTDTSSGRRISIVKSKSLENKDVTRRDFRKLIDSKKIESSDSSNLKSRVLQAKNTKLDTKKLVVKQLDSSLEIKDDPWIVPPLYGAKQILATSIEIEENMNQQWFPELNLDVRYRSAAGLGKRVVQENQEDFVNRAWEQVELINELNQKLRERVLQNRINYTVYRSRFANFKNLDKVKKTKGSQLSNEQKEFLKDIINWYYPMKFSTQETFDKSLFDILSESSIPSGYASAAFYRVSRSSSLKPKYNNKTMTDRLIDDLIFQWKKHELEDLINANQITKLYRFCIERTDFILPLQYL